MEKSTQSRPVRLSITVGLCATIGCILVYGDQFATLAPSALEWREDVRFFARELPKRHKNAFHFISREKFETEVAALDHNLDGMDFDHVFVALRVVTASIGDGHIR